MSPSTFSYSRSPAPLEKLPVELVLEILCYLRIPDIKQFSLVSWTFRPICFSAIFQKISFSASKTPRNFLTDMHLHWPHKCVQKLSFTSIDTNLKPHALLEWCTPAREFEMCSMSNPTIYAPLLSGLSELRVVKLARITFQRPKDFFELLQSLSTKVKDLTIGEDVKFMSMSENDPVLWTGKRIEIECLSVSASLVLGLLLRDDSPVKLSHLKVAETRHAESHTINKFVRLSPRLVNLSIEDPPLESNNASIQYPTTEPLKVAALKTLTLSFHTLRPGSTPLSDLLDPSEAELEELTIRLPLNFVMEGEGEWRWLAFVLLRRSKLKRVQVVAWTTWPYKKRYYAEIVLNDLRRKLEPQRRRISGILANSRYKVTVDVAHWV
ncbi:hypothetical protein EDD18DRAFT_1420209 [Armillaria luteobubalina]|uniref:F-box domain-containing protein n=1 Tax=Armillaria luteobubalina TaxID=153913 RepID=A0AA39PSA1_9AGAR|nr:hypothetical protein EDD18DRAFT_1420209 [Armillaria luteobubalina]